MTGLVYLVIVVLWGIVLVPLWLRRHDESRVKQTAQQYNHAMDTLARASHARRSRHGQRQHRASAPASDEHQPRTQPAPGGTQTSSVRDLFEAARHALTPRAGGRAGIAAKRRRRVVGVLAAAFAVALAGALAGAVPGLVPMVVLGLTLGYLGLAVRLGSAASQTARAAQSQSPERLAETERLRAETEAARRRGRGDPAVDVDSVLAGGPGSVRLLDGNWAPQETALPTYVSKPRASKVPRVLDLTTPNREWTGADMVLQAQAQAEAEAETRAQVEARRRAAEQFEREIQSVQPDQDEQVERLANLEVEPQYRRAANE